MKMFGIVDCSAPVMIVYFELFLVPVALKPVLTVTIIINALLHKYLFDL